MPTACASVLSSVPNTEDPLMPGPLMNMMCPTDVV